MGERRTLGHILVQLGRITEEEVERALEHQQAHGGYFGEALMALQLLTPEELEWGLASQFDLPYVFPDPEAIDPEAASAVSPEWALTHLTMPIMRAGDTLTVVVDSPLRTRAVDELAERTGLQVEMALASPGQIRELIRQVYARASAREEAEVTRPCSLGEALSLALEVGARRFGISTRGRRAGFWYDDAGTVRRRPLDGNWEESLDALLDPPPSGEVGSAREATFTAELAREGHRPRVDVRYLADDAGREFLFRPREEENVLHERFTPPGQGVLTEVRLLARSGSARFIVSADPPTLAPEILPHLPALFFEPSWRSIHLHGGEHVAPEDVFRATLPTEPEAWSEDLETLRAFHFDVVTADLRGRPGPWISRVLDVASVAFILGDGDPEEAREAGVKWRLRASRQEGDHLEWTLSALET